MIKIELYLDKLDFVILKFFYDNGKKTKLSSLTISEILTIKDLKLKSSALRKRTIKMLNYGLLEKGIRQGREFTYFLSKYGYNYLEGVRNEYRNERA